MTENENPAGRRVLIAASDAQTRSFLSVLLTDRGFEPEEVAEGAAFLEALRSRPPAAVLLDLTGNVLQWLHKARQTAFNVPLICLTDGRGLTPEEAAEVGDGYLNKPVRPDELVFTLHRVLHTAQRSQRLRHAQRIELLGRLTGGVVHDLNNLVTVMLGRSDLWLQTCPEDDSSREHAVEIRQAASRASSLTRKLLAFSRREEPTRVRLNVNVVVADLCRMLRSVLPVRIQLETQLDPSVEDIEADLGELEQVVMNLVLNARDAMPGGGRLTLRTGRGFIEEGQDRLPVPAVRLLVSDTGCGMSEEVKARLFEPFFSTKPPGQGTGLGLSIVVDIVRQYGGRIAVESEPGRGSTFTVSLPRAAATAKPEGTRCATPGGSGGSETVLLVEDNDQVAMLASVVLQRRGYNVLVARDGPHALRLGELGLPIQLLLADLGLPGMGGPEVADRMRQIMPGLKVLFMSGNLEGILEPPEGEPSAAHFLEKPFTPDTLADRVRAVLDAP